MTEIKTTISTRLSQADTEFLQRLEMNGARTASEKLRKMVTQARQRSEGADSYAEAKEMLEDLMRPTLRTIADHEHRTGERSEALATSASALPGALAELVAGAGNDAKDKGTLRALEARTVKRAMGLCTQLLRLAMKPRAPCYNPSIIDAERSTIAAIMDALERNHRSDTGEETR